MFCSIDSQLISELCQILMNNKHTCTHKHTLFSQLHT